MLTHLHFPTVLAMNDGLAIGIGAAALVVGLIIGYFVVSSLRGQSLAKSKAEAAEIRARAEAEARTMSESCLLYTSRCV